MSFVQVQMLVDRLTSEEREQLRRRLDFQSWDDQWNCLNQELTESRAARGLPAPTDEDVHDEIDARRTSEQLEALKKEIAIGLKQLDEGKTIPGEEVLARLKKRAEKRLADWQANS